MIIVASDDAIPTIVGFIHDLFGLLIALKE